MKKLGFVLIVMLFPVFGVCQSVKSVVKVPKQEIEVLSGNPGCFKDARSYFLQFDYTDLIVGGYEDEKAYIAYMREDAELRRKNPDEWEEKWFGDRKSVFEPKFLELFNKYAGSKINLDPEDRSQDFVLTLQTQFIEIGFNRNFKKSPTYINVLVTFTEKSGSSDPLVVSMKYLIGDEVWSSYSADFRRIEEAYARCGKELARFMRKKIL